MMTPRLVEDAETPTDPGRASVRVQKTAPDGNRKLQAFRWGSAAVVLLGALALAGVDIDTVKVLAYIVASMFGVFCGFNLTERMGKP